MKKNIFNIWKTKLNILICTGFFYIFTSQVINKIIAFCNIVFIVRILSKHDFGIYSFAINILSIFLLLSGLGATSGLLQFGSENRNNPGKIAAYSRFAWVMGLLSNTVFCILMIIFSIFFDIKIKGAAIILMMLSFRPIVTYIYGQVEIEFRIRLENKAFAQLTMINSTLVLGFTIIGAIFYNLIGAVLFPYIAYIISIVIGAKLAKKYGHTYKNSIILTSNEKKKFFNLSFISSLNNAISQMLYLLDVFMIGIIIPNTFVIAAYKTATTIPFAMLFVPMTIIMYVYPYFASHNNDNEWVRRNYYRLIRSLALLNGCITLLMYIFAPLIITTVFGLQYLESVAPFRILAIGFFIAATFRIPSGNILVSLRRVMFNLYNAIISGIVNILLNIVLITKIGAIGAAFATVAVFIISSLLSTVYLNIIINDSRKPLNE